MNKSRKLHDKAMGYHDKAMVAKRSGNQRIYKALLRKAYRMEKRAAMKLLHALSVEPSRSILFKSAACLATECERYRDADSLICYGLHGNPPEDVANELRKLLNQVREKLTWVLK